MLLFQRALFTLTAVFKASLRAGSSTLRFAALHADLRNIAPIWHCVKCVQIRSFFWSVFSHIWTEYWENERMRENTDQKNSVFGRFSRSVTICLYHSNLQKICIGRFYLRARVGHSQSNNLYRELVLQKVSFKTFAFYRIWILFTVGSHVTSLMFCPFGHRALQTVINY